MAQFEVYELRADKQLAVDVQSDLISGELDSVMVIPLFDLQGARWPFPRLAPILTFESRQYVLATPLMTGLPRIELGRKRGSLADERYTILNAIDFLLTGV